MSKIVIIFLFAFLQHQNSYIEARTISPVSSPLFSPLSSPISPSLAEFSPGIEVGGGNTKMNSNTRLKVALIVACASVGVVMLSLFCLWIFYKRNYGNKPRKKHDRKSDFVNRFSFNQSKGSLNSLKMSSKLGGCVSNMEYKMLEAATGNFDENNVLGVGGFGCVYKAKLDGDCYVAVKKINVGVQEAEREFENEIALLSKIRHQNIITLLGCCIHGDTRFLVYELMENGCLETQLHGVSRGSSLTWHIRMKIALDIARGLEYLHEHCNPPVIHRDLKSSNILLDAELNAKLSDFGFAITNGPHIKNNIKLSGTIGYVAPEYLLDGKLTDKSDVYAFGVVLLELLLGRKPVEKLSPSQCQSIVTWAMPQLTDRSKLPNIVDPVIRDTMDPKHLYQVAAVAVLCVQPEPSYRPLIIDVMHSLVPLVPVELGGTLRINQRANTRASETCMEQQTA
ncbi:probable receptor-like protein kinase At1g80640 [Chenopodium quinoa]|uniref:probable receptor-like protein kinase At1g80640 n=1 Tax=Chenopodium quinoa TaxID=63459 RepID=UPI000B76C53D|nr:probable receptor-like protein kinase At1g80640 [Chenopodium quinoa]